MYFANEIELYYLSLNARTLGILLTLNACDQCSALTPPPHIAINVENNQMSENVNVREFLRRLRNDRYFKDARANREETHVW